MELFRSIFAIFIFFLNYSITMKDLKDFDFHIFRRTPSRGLYEVDVGFGKENKDLGGNIPLTYVDLDNDKR